MKNTLILIADASRARIFDADSHYQELTLRDELEHPRSRLLDSEMVTDRPGRAQKGLDGSVRTALDASSSAHEREAESFAVELTRKLKTLAGDDLSRRLVLVAAPRFLGLLRKHLPPALAKQVVASFDRDLTQMALPELRATLQAGAH